MFIPLILIINRSKSCLWLYNFGRLWHNGKVSLWPIFETACSLQILTLSFQGHPVVPCELQKVNLCITSTLTAPAQRLSKTLIFKWKRQGVKNTVETFMMLILADRTNICVVSRLYHTLFLVTVGNSCVPGEIIRLQGFFYHFLLRNPWGNKPPGYSV